MSDEISTTIIEQPHFEDGVAARGEVLLRMCLGAAQIKSPKAREVLLRGAERIIASIPVAKGEGASVKPLETPARL